MNCQTDQLDIILRLAEEAGFKAAPLDASLLKPDPEVRKMCEENRCRKYGSSWSCPPAIGSLESAAEAISAYSSGILVQSIFRTDGDFDLDTISTGDTTHKKRFDQLVRQVRYYYPSCMPMASGTCTRCAKCTYPDLPCRFPDRLFPSMEAYGLLINPICEKCGLKYNNGTGTMTFISCILLF